MKKSKADKGGQEAEAKKQAQPRDTRDTRAARQDAKAIAAMLQAAIEQADAAVATTEAQVETLVEKYQKEYEESERKNVISLDLLTTVAARLLKDDDYAAAAERASALWSACYSLRNTRYPLFRKAGTRFLSWPVRIRPRIDAHFRECPLRGGHVAADECRQPR